MKTDLGSRVVRAWAIVPAAVNEREQRATMRYLRPGGQLRGRRVTTRKRELCEIFAESFFYKG